LSQNEEVAGYRRTHMGGRAGASSIDGDKLRLGRMAGTMTGCAVSMLIRRALMIGVDVRALLLDVRLASSPGQKRVAANCVGSAYCVPAVRDTSLGGIGSLNVKCHEILQNAPLRETAPQLSSPATPYVRLWPHSEHT
jgi:hypothetical protein